MEQERDKRKEYLRSRQFSGLVGNRLRRAREWSDLQHEDMANALGVSAEHARKIEKGIWLPTVGELVILSELYGCSADWVLGLSGDPQTLEERVAIASQAPLEPVENYEALELDRCEGERPQDHFTVPEDQASRNRMCYSKRKFRGEDAAIRAAIKTSGCYSHPMRPYHCPLCGGWHLTSRELPDPRP